MRLIPLSVALWVAVSASAQDPQLNALHATLVTLHSPAKEVKLDARGARPELTVAKHQLRNWIETQLGSLNDGQNTKTLSDRINKALEHVSISSSGNDPGAYQNLSGSLSEVRIRDELGMLIVTTGVGIVCGNDESAYGYKLANGHWQRVWESEQNDYSSKKYAPQHIIDMHVWQSLSGDRENNPPFVLTLGNHDWCTSSWHPVYYRLWRMDSSSGPKLLIDASEEAWLRTYTYIVGSIAGNRLEKNAPVDVLIEFTERSIDAGIHNREAVRHYLIDGDRVQRVDPVALSPRDFVDEWLTRAWKESATWSAAPALQRWHAKLHADFVGGEFGQGTTHCQTPDLWQVAFEPHDTQKDFAPESEVYFLIRWRPPYHFTMINVADKPWPLCTQEDREADAWRTLFSTQEWRQ